MLSKFKIIISFALRDILRSKTIFFLTILSLIAVFTAVILSAGILDGFQTTLQNGSIDTGGHLTIKAEKGKDSIADVDRVATFLNGLESVAGFSVRSYGSAVTKIDGEVRGNGYASIGVEPRMEGKASMIPYRLIKGRYLKPNDTRSVVIGVSVADALKGLMYDKKKIEVGDKIRYISLVADRSREYEVVGIVDAKYFHPNWTSYFPKKELEWLDETRKDNEIIIRLKDPAKIEEIKNQIERDVSGVDVFSWQEKEGYVFNIVVAVKFITANITNLLIVTTFVIMNVIIYINVTQRRRQIGVMKSMGSSNRFIVAIYVFETLVYFACAFIFATIIFLGIHFFFITHPVPMLIGDLKTVVLFGSIFKTFSILISAALIGSFVPAYIAARTRIVDVLRGNS